MAIGLLQRDQQIKKANTLLRPVFGKFETYIFGSTVDGKANLDSDLDLVIILEETTLKVSERMTLAKSALMSLEIPVDVFVFTNKEFQKQSEDFGSIAYIAKTTGVLA